MTAKSTRSRGRRLLVFLKRRLWKRTFAEVLALVALLVALSNPLISIRKGELKAEADNLTKREKDVQVDEKKNAHDKGTLDANRKQLAEEQARLKTDKDYIAKQMARFETEKNALQAAATTARKHADESDSEIKNLRQKLTLAGDQFEASKQFRIWNEESQPGKEKGTAPTPQYTVKYTVGWLTVTKGKEGCVLSVDVVALPESSTKLAPIELARKEQVFKYILSFRDDLYYLRLNGVTLTKNDLEKLSVLKELRTLELLNAGIDDKAIEALQLPNNLIALNLEQNPFATLPDYVKNHSLEWINLSGTKCRSDVLAKFAWKLPKLQTIIATDVKCDPLIVYQLVGMKAMRGVWVNLDNMEEEDWVHVARVCGPRTIDLGYVVKGSIREDVEKTMKQIAPKLTLGYREPVTQK